MIGQFRHLHFEELGSTNVKAHELAAKGELGPLWISADVQTSGRGRRGRDWVSPTGNLYATLLISLPVKPITAMQMSFVTALAINDTATKILGPKSSALALKWPNDVLLDNEKLAGILIETVQAPTNGKTTLAIGCGVNISSAPSNTNYGATYLNQHLNTPTTARQFLQRFDSSMSRWLDAWRYGENFNTIINAWQHVANSIGKQVSLINNSDVTIGTFKGLAADGALILSLPDGSEKHFHAGDVSLRTS